MSNDDTPKPSSFRIPNAGRRDRLKPRHTEEQLKSMIQHELDGFYEALIELRSKINEDNQTIEALETLEEGANAEISDTITRYVRAASNPFKYINLIIDGRLSVDPAPTNERSSFDRAMSSKLQKRVERQSGRTHVGSVHLPDGERVTRNPIEEDVTRIKDLGIDLVESLRGYYDVNKEVQSLKNGDKLNDIQTSTMDKTFGKIGAIAMEYAALAASLTTNLDPLMGQLSEVQAEGKSR